MENFLRAIEEKDYFSALKFLLQTLKSSGTITSALLVNGDFENGEIIYKVGNIGKISMDLVEMVLIERSPIFEKRSNASIYVRPIFHSNSFLGFLYIEKDNDKRSFSEGEKGLLRIAGETSSLCLIKRIEERNLGQSFMELWIGSSSFSKRIKEEIERAKRFSPILIEGETGVGKTLLAELIHKASGRKGEFVVISSTTIPDSLFESELFGHKKGAFTGALNESIGLAGEADGGTLFLDDISELPLSLQGKFLRFIDTGCYRRLGDTKERKSNCGIICATNRNLLNEVRDGRFREDLYFRISSYIIKIPPLRERKEDIEEIAKTILGKNGFSINDFALKILKEYNFPGNVRELINILKKLQNEAIFEKKIDEEIVKKVMSSHISLHNSISQTQRVNSEESVEIAHERMQRGESFWDIVKKPFLERELSKEEVKRIVFKGLERTETGSYKELCKLFNISSHDYKKFISFLHRHKIIAKKQK